jgi:energy-coupling factor transporter ATP-binding protein EcfA2
MNSTITKPSRGSSWRKWDLHVHTPDSLVNHYGGGADVWDRFLLALADLPPEFKVLGINDYIFLDGYKKVVAAKAAGKLPNIDLLLPVIELRLDKFGGSRSDLSKVNYHIIFSNEIGAETIESQFLSALSSKYVLTPEYDEIRTSGKWAAVPTRQSIEDLGRLIIESVPATERHKFNAPMTEGFNNLCLNLNAIQEILTSHYFVGKTLTAVGKTEWADIKWNDQSIADKKTIINGAELVFIASETVADWTKAQKSLTDACVNNRLVDCSDAHRFADSTNKDRLANCFTWINADPTFEGLRQAVFEYPNRIQISENPPLEPLLQVKKVELNFPQSTQLEREGRTDIFCFRGAFEFNFSPYLTCIIGGRGTGKSTLLNLIHEKLDPKSTEFFKENNLIPSEVTIEDTVTIEGVSEQGVVEFLQQNEIEQFASDHKRLTSAIFTRLRKLDTRSVLKEREVALNDAVQAVEEQIKRVISNHDVSDRLTAAEKELTTQKGLVESFENTDYKRINEELGNSNRQLQALKTSKARLEELVQGLRNLLKLHEVIPAPDVPLNYVDQQTLRIIERVQQALGDSLAEYSSGRAEAQEVLIESKVRSLRAELDTFLKQRGLSQENQSDVGRASERIAKLEEEIVRLKNTTESLRTAMAVFVPQRKELELYSSAVDELLSPINGELKGLSSEVKPIELRYKFDLKAFRGAMIRYVADALGQVEGRAAREDYLDGKLKDLDFSSLPERDDACAAIPEDSTVYGKILRDFFLQGVNYELLKLEAEKSLLNVRKLGQIHVLYDDKPVENSSFGQRCTAVIVVLLLLGNMPIVIDEPEAHLDSALIAKYLVDLIKSRKNHRQIIFATHNANLVINGDAELVHCLSMDDSKITQVVTTTIEDLSHRDLLLALEGGEEAFHQREKRYGID